MAVRAETVKVFFRVPALCLLMVRASKFAIQPTGAGVWCGRALITLLTFLIFSDIMALWNIKPSKTLCTVSTMCCSLGQSLSRDSAS